MDLPETRYVRSTDGSKIAYQVTGDGPLDIVVLGGGPIPIDLLWDDPGFIRVSRRLSTFSRTIWFEMRGWGASDGNPRDSLRREVFDADLTAVLEAMDCDRITLLGWGYTGGRALQFAASHAERLNAIILLNAYAYYIRGDDYPIGLGPKDVDRFMTLFREGWGTGSNIELLVPSRRSDERFKAWWARSERLELGGDQIAAFLLAAFEMDLRPLLPLISMPTLVLHRVGNQYVELRAGQYLAEHIPGAKFVALDGDEHPFFVGDTDSVADEVEDFLTGRRQGAESDVLTATIMFTDIVSSTEHQARIGHRAWSRLSDHHDAIIRTSLVSHRGQEVKTTGDGFLATFDATGRALRCAADILAAPKSLGLELRAGVHTGDVERRGDDIGGLTVTIAKRVCDLAGPGEVLVSEAVPRLVTGSDIVFRDRGEHELKGVPGTWKLFAIQA